MPKKSNVQFVRNIRTPKPKIKKPPKRKNVSQKVPNGTILQTRDEYFEGAGNYRKPGYQNKGNYRKAVVVDSNRNNELAVVKGTSKGKPLNNPQFLGYKPFIHTIDDEGHPIQVNSKFIINNSFLDSNAINEIKRDSLKNSSNSLRKQNRTKLRNLKGRK